jgi:hypothetical protein
MLTSLQHYKLGVNTFNKLIMVMKNWLGDAKVDCLWEGDSIDYFFKEEVNIIEKNNTTLGAAGYFNVDELE